MNVLLHFRSKCQQRCHVRMLWTAGHKVHERHLASSPWKGRNSYLQLGLSQIQSHQKGIFPCPHYAKKKFKRRVPILAKIDGSLAVERKVTRACPIGLRCAASNKSAYRHKELLAAVQYLCQPAKSTHRFDASGLLLLLLVSFL